MKKIIITSLCIVFLYTDAAPEKPKHVSLDERLSSTNRRIDNLESSVERIENSIDDIKEMLTEKPQEKQPVIKVVKPTTARIQRRRSREIHSPRTGCPAGKSCSAASFNPSGDTDCKLYCNRMYAGIDEQQRACYARCGSSNDPVNSGILPY